MNQKEFEFLYQALERIEGRLKSHEDRLDALEKSLEQGYDDKRVAIARDGIAKKKVLPGSYSWFNYLEFNFGAYILQILGIVVLLLGVGFLLKYSIDQGLVTPGVRVLFGACLGSILLSVAELWRTRYNLWARACSAGGIILYYLSAYAAYTLYDILSAQTAFAFFIGTTVLAVAISLAYNSGFVAAVSLLGGCLTPLVVNSYSPVFLSVYLLVLAGVFSLISAVKRWHWLPLVSLVFLSYYYTITLQSNLTGLQLTMYVITFFYIYNLPYYYGLAWSYVSDFWEVASVFCAGIFSFYAWQHIAMIRFPDLQPAAIFVQVAVIAGIYYAWYTWYLHKKNRINQTLLLATYTLALGSFAAAIIKQWAGCEQSIALHVLGLCVFILGVRVHEPIMRLGAYALWLYSTAHMVRLLPFWYQPISFFIITLTVGVLVAVFCIAAYYVRYINQFAYAEGRWLQNLLLGGAVTTVVYWFHTPVWSSPYHIMGLIIYALLLFLSGIALEYTFLRRCAYWIGSLGIIYFGIHYALVNMLHPYYWVRLNLLFISCIGSFLVAAFYAARHTELLTKYEQSILPKVLRLGAAFFIYAWLRANIIVWFDPVQQPGLILARIWGDYDETTALVRTHFTNVILTMYYTLYAIIIVTIGLIFNDKWLRYLGLVLICIALGKLALMITVMPNTTHRIVAFILVGLLLIAGSFIYQKFSKREQLVEN